MRLNADRLPRSRASRVGLVRRVAMLVACVAVTITARSGAQDVYQLPPAPIVDIVDAAPTPTVMTSPDRSVVLLAQRPALPSIRDLARPAEHLAGLQLDAATRGRHNPSTYVSLSLLDVMTGETRTVTLPEGARVASPTWSPNGRMVAFQRVLDVGRELWVLDVASASARRLTDAILNDVLGGAVQWMPDAPVLLVRTVPDDAAPAPTADPTPTGPLLQETAGRTAPTRTYRDLLDDPAEADLFEHLATSQLLFVDATTGETRPLGEPAVFARVSPSPNGRWLLVSRVQRPYSYHVPWSRFPETLELWSRRGGAAFELARLPLRDTTPIGGVATGPRSMRWHAEMPAALLWAEALDGGDPKADVPHRDQLVALAIDREPKSARAIVFARLEHRFNGLDVLDDGRFLVTEYDRDRRWTTTWLMRPDFQAAPTATETTPRVTRLVDRSVLDRYGDPGRPVTEPNGVGRSVVRVRGGAIWLRASGATPEGDLPVVRRMALPAAGEDAGAPEDVWRCAPGSYEPVLAVLDPTVRDGVGPVLLTSHETPDAVPQLQVRTVGVDTAPRRLTAWADPCPQLRGVHKELVTYERDDGVTLSATLYLPPDHQPGQRHPLLVWAYPREFTDASTAGQISGSPWRFTRPSGSSHLMLLTQGYAVMDRASLPVIGDPETVNDTFVSQIVAGAQAAIDCAVAKGVADRERVAVGGHSYGAFMTANLLAHSDLFKAGIARSGAYNRTLTPFGFQAERRTVWEATDTYVKVSPFLAADRINEPMLMIHGANDPNSGTHPMQSGRMYHALRGQGATARLVMLPHEGHGYRARESVLHVHAEQVAWLDRWIGAGEDAP